MSTFDIILRVLLWIIIGAWVAYKREWYKEIDNAEGAKNFFLTITVVFGPISLFIAFVIEMVFNKWKNNEDRLG